MSRPRPGLAAPALAAALALLAAATTQQLRRPAGRRTWQGSVAGVPYDLRPPRLHRELETLWAPDDGRLLVPRSFGIGWTLNLARLVRPRGAGRGRPARRSG